MRTLVLAVILAGCVAPLAPTEAPQDAGDAPVFDLRATGHVGGEPTVGVTASGAIFTVAFEKVLRSTDDGATWEDVTPVLNPPRTLDPFLYVDHRTDRIFVSQLTVACIVLSWSDDDGETWTTNPVACGAPVDDHQKIAVGGRAPGGSGPFDGTVYISEHMAHAAFGVNNAKVLFVSRSLDGGWTWQAVPALTSLDSNFRTTGPLSADLEGNVVVPVYLLPAEDRGGTGDEATIAVLVSHDHGETYELVRVADGATPARGIDPTSDVGPDGTFWLAWSGADGRAYLARSEDGGASWSAPTAATPAGRSIVFPTVEATAAGPAVAYLATEGGGLPEKAAPGAIWRVRVAGPGWDVAAGEDPAQIGPLCGRGVRCETGRNHLDFIGVDAAPDGRIVVSYTDGCVDPCRDASASTVSTVAVAVQR